MAIYLAYSPME